MGVGSLNPGGSSFQPRFSRDLDLVYGLKTFTLKVEGHADLVLVKSVMEHPKRKMEMDPSGGQVVQLDREFTWGAHWTDRVVGDVPLGSVLVDARYTYWTILTTNRIEETNTITVHCRNLSIMSSAINQATILKAKVFRKGMANETIPVWRGYVSNQCTPTEADQVACRFQPSSSDAIIRFSGEWEKETFRCFFDQPLPLDLSGSEYRLVDMNGERYRIVSYYDASRIDRLPCAIAIKIIEGAEYFRPDGTPLPLPSPIPVQG